MAPVFEALCGPWRNITDMEFPVGHSDGYKATDSTDPNAYWVKAKGDSMLGFDIKEGNYLLVEPNTQIENENIVLAIHPEEGCTVKKHLKVGDRAQLKPGNSDYPDIPLDNGGSLFRMFRIQKNDGRCRRRKLVDTITFEVQGSAHEPYMERNMRSGRKGLISHLKKATSFILPTESTVCRWMVLSVVMEQRMEKVEVDAEWVLQNLVNQFKVSIDDFVKIDDAGNPSFNFSKATNEQRAAIDSLQIDSAKVAGVMTSKIRLSLNNKLKLLEVIGKHVDVGAFKDRVQVESHRPSLDAKQILTDRINAIRLRRDKQKEGS